MTAEQIPTPPSPPDQMPPAALEGLVEIPTLKSLFIEVLFGELVIGKATGFLACRSSESRCVLLTNRHVVTGRHQEDGKCLDKNQAIPDAIRVHFLESETRSEWLPVTLPLFAPDSSPLWIEHPTLGAKADVVAINLEWGRDVARYPYYLDSNHDRNNMVLSPAEPVSVIGFPFGRAAFGKLPIWATGFLAQDLALIDPAAPQFLIDCRARSGQSGSPVIAFRVGNLRHRRDGKLMATVNPNPTWEFLGIYCGRINAESDLGVVWHVSALGALVDAAESDYTRRMKSRQGSDGRSSA